MVSTLHGSFIAMVFSLTYLCVKLVWSKEGVSVQLISCQQCVPTKWTLSVTDEVVVCRQSGKHSSQIVHFPWIRRGYANFSTQKFIARKQPLFPPTSSKWLRTISTNSTRKRAHPPYCLTMVPVWLQRFFGTASDNAQRYKWLCLNLWFKIHMYHFQNLPCMCKYMCIGKHIPYQYLHTIDILLKSRSRTLPQERRSPYLMWINITRKWREKVQRPMDFNTDLRVNHMMFKPGKATQYVFGQAQNMRSSIDHKHSHNNVRQISYANAATREYWIKDYREWFKANINIPSSIG